MNVKRIKNKMPLLTLAAAVLMTAAGLGLILMPGEWIQYALMIVEVGALFLYGGLRAVQAVINKKPQKGAVAMIMSWGIGSGLLYCGFSGQAAAVMPSIIVGSVSIIMGLMRLLICINCTVNHVKGAVRNGFSAFLCLAFGLFLVVRPIYNFDLLALVAGFYLIFYGVTMLIDALAAMFGSDMDENKLDRRIHFAAPNLITAVRPARMIAAINKQIASGSLESGMLIEQKENAGFDTVNLEIMVHLTTQGANKFGHVDIALGDTVYSYGTYDSSKVKFGGFVSQGNIIIVPKIPYLKYCLDYQKKYVIGFGAYLSEKQLATVKRRIDEALSNSEVLVSEYEKAVAQGRDGSELNDSASNIVRDCGGRVYTVIRGMFRRYFGINTNCVRFADWLLSETGIDAISFSGLRTPGAYYAMLQNMFTRKNTRVFRKISYILSDEISHVDKLD